MGQPLTNEQIASIVASTVEKAMQGLRDDVQALQLDVQQLKEKMPVPEKRDAGSKALGEMDDHNDLQVGEE